MTLDDQFGAIDIYLFDQLLKGRVAPGDRVLDAGCGGGRNLVYLLGQGWDAHGVDVNPVAIDEVRALAARLAPRLPPANFQVAPVERMGYPDGAFDVVLSSAVLHFARDHAQFDAMVREMWRVLRLGGMLFCRLASSIGIADRVVSRGEGRYLVPDGTERYLVDKARLLSLTASLGGRLLDPIKTTIVEDQRAMTTWVVRKSG